MNEPTNPALRRLVIEFAIAATLLAGSGVWATRFWNAWIASGGQPSFYQNYFEPAVMVACGKGFVVSQVPRPQALEDFLNRRRDAMACSDLPANLPVGRRGLFTGAWIYLQTTVGWAWRVLGISWSRMGPLFGLLFGVVIALAYGIFRLGMGRAAALVGALGLATSCIHLENLPHLRDYAKAPFTLALVLILGILVARPVRRGPLLALAVAYGAVLGIGYGFRTDFLINVPVFLIVVFAFLDGGVGKNLVLKAAASLVCLATFAAVSWPVTSAVYQEGGCQWHVALLGMQSPFDDSLHLAPAPYEFGYAYSDPYVIATVQGFAHRTQPAGAPIPHYCSHEYDVQSGRLLKTIVTTFPGDFVARAYASVLQVAELPFLSWASPLNGWAAGLFDWRRAVLEPKIGWGVYAQAAALLIAAGWSLRLGFFLAFFVAYFGGYPAVQFQERHHFHLEFMTWWALGFVVHQTAVAIWSLKRGLPPVAALVGGFGRSIVVALSAIALTTGVLAGARRYQKQQARQLLGAYIAAPKLPLEAGNVLPTATSRNWPQYLEIDLNEASCPPRPAVTFRYTPDPLSGDLSRTITIGRRARAPGLTRVLLPVFEGFKGVELPDTQSGCTVGAYRFAEPLTIPLLLGATLRPNWNDQPLYQRLNDWEADTSLPPMTPLPAFSLWTAGPGPTGDRFQAGRAERHRRSLDDRLSAHQPAGQRAGRLARVGAHRAVGIARPDLPRRARCRRLEMAVAGQRRAAGDERHDR